jgi:hypothetical protein
LRADHQGQELKHGALQGGDIGRAATSRLLAKPISLAAMFAATLTTKDVNRRRSLKSGMAGLLLIKTAKALVHPSPLNR